MSTRENIRLIARAPWRLLNFYNKLFLKFGQQNATEMRFCWRTGDGPTLNAGLVSQGNRTRFA